MSTTSRPSGPSRPVGVQIGPHLLHDQIPDHGKGQAQRIGPHDGDAVILEDPPLDRVQLKVTVQAEHAVVVGWARLDPIVRAFQVAGLEIAAHHWPPGVAFLDGIVNPAKRVDLWLGRPAVQNGNKVDVAVAFVESPQRNRALEVKGLQ